MGRAALPQIRPIWFSRPDAGVEHTLLIEAMHQRLEGLQQGPVGAHVQGHRALAHLRAVEIQSRSKNAGLTTPCMPVRDLRAVCCNFPDLMGEVTIKHRYGSVLAGVWKERLS
jgi:hypothetical protein